MASAELTSTRSPRVAAARRLAKRAFRASDRRFLAEGPQAVREALRRHATVPTVLELFVTSEAAARHSELLDGSDLEGARLDRRALDELPVHRVSGEVMASLTQTVTPQGIVAVCALLDQPLDAVLSERPRLVTVLANVRDPGNAGTVIRTADAAGADAVIVSDSSVDVYNGKCVRASAGSLFHLPVVVGQPVEALLPRLRAAGLQVLAADGAGTTDLDDAVDGGLLGAATAWVFGNEAWGLPVATRELADDVVRVPISGAAESLNLATAAAVCLFASARAHRPGTGNIRAEPS